MSDEQTPGEGLDLGSLLGGLGGEGGGGLGGLFAQAQAAMEASQAAADTELIGSSGGGVVRVTATGTGEVLAVAISPEVVDPTDIETLQDLIVAAMRDVTNQISALQAGAMGDLDPTSMLGGLSGLFGGDPEDDE
ncbi:YbaB/EbfC family nucleoid-associated protein [Actinospongicola halichondriae]|uniref:YbaB/EbfC family nucleoid-associated protein n=1 Tax=Actinospongicola halichondriae TaxID=3236844 RepID=UPI003D55529F